MPADNDVRLSPEVVRALERFAAEQAKETKSRSIVAAVVGIGGILVALAVAIYALFFIVTNTDIRNAPLPVQIEHLNNRLDDLEKQLKELERRLPNRSSISANNQDRTPVTTSEFSLGNLPLKDYILLAIYCVLLVMLVSGSSVAIFAAQGARKETALEITKTLMSFFIGVATGHV